MQVDKILDICIAAATASTTNAEQTQTTLKNVVNGGLPTIPSSSKECTDIAGISTREEEYTVSITVVGASGDLAKKKIFPALFALYHEDCLPKVWLLEPWILSLIIYSKLLIEWAQSLCFFLKMKYKYCMMCILHLILAAFYYIWLCSD